jgi:hypothetical protein
MIYYPYTAKKSGFISEESLVPTTYTNNISFFEIEKIEDEVLLKTINKESVEQYKELYQQNFYIDDYFLKAIYAVTKDNRWMIYDISTDDESCYFKTVKKWEEELEYYDKENN